VFPLTLEIDIVTDEYWEPEYWLGVYFAHWPVCTPTLAANTDKEISVKIKKTMKIAGVYLVMRI